MTFNEAELAELTSGRQRIAVFFRLETDPVVRLWLGAGKIKPGVNTLDPSGVVYNGFGAITNVPAFKQLLNGTAERVEFTLSGVSGDVLAVASGDDADAVKGKKVSIGFGLMGVDWSMLGAVKWCATYRADYLSLSQSLTPDPGQPPMRTLTLSCGSRFTGRRRPAYSYFTDQDQTARSPGDRFCVYTPNWAHGYSKPWPYYP